MGLWSKIKEIFGFAPKKDKIRIIITCKKCKEEFDSVFRRSYDFQPTYGEEEYDYSINKQLVCPGCYKSMNLNLKLNQGLEILEQELEEGELKLADETKD